MYHLIPIHTTYYIDVSGVTLLHTYMPFVLGVIQSKFTLNILNLKTATPSWGLKKRTENDRIYMSNEQI